MFFGKKCHLSVVPFGATRKNCVGRVDGEVVDKVNQLDGPAGSGARTK